MRNDRDMIPVFSVVQVRAAEARAIATLPKGELMARAVRGIFRVCRQLLLDRNGRMYGSRVVILVGAGNNGADSMWTGVQLANRGVQVVAVAATENVDQASSAALRAAGGRVLGVEAAVAEPQLVALFDQADIILDGLLGIGGKGALREPAASWSQLILDSPAEIISVDLPSGVDPDSGVVADPAAVIQADQTVCLGTLKAGLIWGDGPDFAGKTTLVDIGLLEYFVASTPVPLLQIANHETAKSAISRPSRQDNKYTRGVVGVVTGSESYPGAAVLSTGAALVGGTGMVRYAGGAPQAVVSHWPEVVIAPTVDPQSKTHAWVVGSGGGVDQAAGDRLKLVLQAQVPVVLDADALTLLASSDQLREILQQRYKSQLVTVLTPHEGEFARLGYQVAAHDGLSRRQVLRQAAQELGAIILLKGATTLVATPAGAVFANIESSPALATAGSGDVLAGLLGSMLAHRNANLAGATGVSPGVGASAMSFAEAGIITVAAAQVHGQAGIVAERQCSSVVATDILNAITQVSDYVGLARVGSSACAGANGCANCNASSSGRTDQD